MATAAAVTSHHRPMRPTIPQALLLAVLPIFNSTAIADDELSLAQVVTCGFQTDDATFSKANRVLRKAARKNADGSYQVPGRVTSGELCVENAQVSGGFGVVGTTASLCTTDAKPLVDFAQQAMDGLKLTAHPPQAGIVAAYEAPHYTLVIFRGEASREIKPDPASKRLSYFCTYQGTGPQ